MKTVEINPNETIVNIEQLRGEVHHRNALLKAGQNMLSTLQEQLSSDYWENEDIIEAYKQLDQTIIAAKNA